MVSSYAPPEVEVSHVLNSGDNPSLKPSPRRDFTSLAKSLRNNEAIANMMGKTFRLLQRLGVSVTPNHFYWPIPDTGTLEKRAWPVYAMPAGCDFNLEQQVRFANELVLAYRDEYKFPDYEVNSAYHYNNGYFETVDAEIAYAYVRATKPSRIVEIGSGYSTRILAAALEKNRELNHKECELITIDPSSERLPRKSMGTQVRVLTESIQQVDLKFFEELESGDILFIDSSHVVGIGSDVVREYLEILPRLRPGVTVHLHDIFLPLDYPREFVLKHFWFWTEQYLLQAFLSFNKNFEVLWASSAMQYFYPSVLENVFPRWAGSYLRMPKEKRRFVPSYDQNRLWPSSFWMRRL